MLKLKRFDEGKWSEYQPGVEFKIKPLSRYDILGIRTRCKRKFLIQGAPPPDNIMEEVDSGMVSFEILKICLLEAKGVEVGDTDKPSHELLVEMVYEREELVNFIVSRAHEMFASEEKKVEQELKNSERSQNG
jgi:hypothetical protein